MFIDSVIFKRGGTPAVSAKREYGENGPMSGACARPILPQVQLWGAVATPAAYAEHAHLLVFSRSL